MVIYPASEEVIERLRGESKGYYIDFECWTLTASGPIEAERLANEKLKRGEYPAICGIVPED